jgi:probable rRNA maturation factor
MIEIDLFVEDPRFSPHASDWQAFAERAVLAAFAPTAFGGLVHNEGHYDLSIRLMDDASMRTLNRDTRGKDQPTNVLSFQFIEAPDAETLAYSPAATLGDMALAYETVAREAESQGKSFDAHAAHLIVHGVLHLLGFDHLDESGAQDMEAIERHALSRLGIADPYDDIWTPIDTHE